MEVRVGTSGWSYPSGAGTWDGIFYPARGRSTRPRGFDELAYYAEHFNTVEVNSTFYGPPRAAVTRRWVERTPPEFVFSLKLYQQFTHPKMFQVATRAATWSVGQPDVDRCLLGLDPIASAGKLGVLLAQFPPSFKQNETSLSYLEWLLTRFHDWPVAVELRHRSWSDHVADTLTRLNQLGAAWVQIDEPKFRFSIQQNQLPNIESFYYMRLHGRNAEKWWRHDTAEQRYDYLYTDAELAPFARTADAARRLVKKLYLYLNNHFAAKAVANAVSLKAALGEPTPGNYPRAFVERYPQVRDLVHVGVPDLPQAPDDAVLSLSHLDDTDPRA